MRRLAPAVAAISLAAACSAGRPAATPTTVATTTTVEAATTTTVPAPTTSPPTTVRARPPSTTTTTAVSASAEAVAAAILASETAIRDPAVPVAELESAGRSQQLAYRQLVEHPEWMEHVLARMPTALRPVVRAHVRAGTELRALTKPRTALPPWRIVAPAPAEELLAHYKEAERLMGVPWYYLAAIHLVETRMGRIRGTSVAGAQGPMQFLPATWERYGEGGDINSNRDSILAAARLLARNGAPGNMAGALYRYNPTQRYVVGITAYAEQMRAHERAYHAYYHWQVYYRMVDGDRLLPVGYGS